MRKTENRILQCFVFSGATGGASGPIDEDLFDDEDLDELEEDMTNLNMEI